MAADPDSKIGFNNDGLRWSKSCFLDCFLSHFLALLVSVTDEPGINMVLELLELLFG